MAFRALALPFRSDEELKRRTNIINSFDKKKVVLHTLLFNQHPRCGLLKAIFSMSCRFFWCARFQIRTFVWLLYLEKVRERGFLTTLSHAPWSSRTNQPWQQWSCKKMTSLIPSCFRRNNFLSRFAGGLLCFNLSFTSWVLHRKSEDLRMVDR